VICLQCKKELSEIEQVDYSSERWTMLWFLLRSLCVVLLSLRRSPKLASYLSVWFLESRDPLPFPSSARG
jgi:hypothetical protein